MSPREALVAHRSHARRVHNPNQQLYQMGGNVDGLQDGKNPTGNGMYPPNPIYPPNNSYTLNNPYPPNNMYLLNNTYPPSNMYPLNNAYPPSNMYPSNNAYPLNNMYPSNNAYPLNGTYPSINLYPPNSFYPPGLVYASGQNYGQNPLWLNHSRGGYENDANSPSPLTRWIEEFQFLDGLKVLHHVGYYDGKRDPDNLIHYGRQNPEGNTMGGLRKKNKDKRDMFSPYKEANIGILQSLTKSPREILAIEKVGKAFTKPPKMLKTKIEEAGKSRKLAHFINGIRKVRTKQTDTQLGEWITPAVKAEPVMDGKEEPILMIGVGRVLLDGGAACDIIYEHCFLKFRKEVRERRKDVCQIKTPKIGDEIFVTEHKLNEENKITPIQKKKRVIAPERSTAASKEVEELRKAGILRETRYQTWVANTVMVKKTDRAWRMCVDFIDINKACPKECYSLPEID
ncbi:hypothetical protein Tco_0149027 [Tanacetum coccineum]